MLSPTAVIVHNAHGYTVWFDWTAAGVDRPRSFGISTGFSESLATRLAVAINAGAVTRDAVVATDVEGRTYVEATSLVMGKYLEADLARLGF